MAGPFCVSGHSRLTLADIAANVVGMTDTEHIDKDATRRALERATAEYQAKLAADMAFLADAVEAGEPLSGPLARTLLVGAARLAAALAARA